MKTMLNFLREVHLLKDLPYAMLKKGHQIFRPMEREPLLHNFLYKEKEEANFVYLIVKGSFLVLKKVKTNLPTGLLFDENFNQLKSKITITSSNLNSNFDSMKK